MAILDILTAPDPFLKKVALRLEKVDDGVRKKMHNMLETMYHDRGVGLASIQVGIIDKIIVLDLKDDDESEREDGFYPLFMANPEIMLFSDNLVEATEYCLSVPEQGVKVCRPDFVKVKYLDYNNHEQMIETGGWLARALQHEIDHVEGKIIVDYLSPVKKDAAIRKLLKIKKFQSYPKL